MIKRYEYVIFYLTVLWSFFVATAVLADSSHRLRLSLTPPALAQKMTKFESEHRSVGKRQYWLNPSPLSDNLEAHVIFPDGMHEGLPIKADEKGKSITIRTPWGDGPRHGIHNLYVVERYVEDDTLMVHVAKWITIHHSCAWGHEYKHNPDRLAAKAFDQIPLEITGSNLWDGNFHVKTSSAQSLKFMVMRHGKPIPGAKVSIRSAQHWVKEMSSREDGSFEFTLVEDYFPKTWSLFKRNHKGELFLFVELDVEQVGTMHGKSYKKIHFTSSLPWRYSPAKQSYTSYVAGLTIGGGSFLLTVFGIFLYRLKRKRPFQELVFDEKA